MSITKIKQTWISVNLIMIIMMIIIGGITRLTDSGLSMTEWNLIGGIIPPLNQGDWLELLVNIKIHQSLFKRILIFLYQSLKKFSFGNIFIEFGED